MNDIPQEEPRHFTISMEFSVPDRSPEACPLCHSAIDCRKISDIAEGQEFQPLASTFGRNESVLRFLFSPPALPEYNEPSLFSDPNHARYLEVLIYLALFVVALIQWQTDPPVLILAGVVAVSLMAWRVRQIHKALERMAKADFEKRLSVWKQALECWRHVRYCYSDHVIFIPGGQLTLKPENLNALLENEAYKQSRQDPFSHPD